MRSTRPSQLRCRGDPLPHEPVYHRDTKTPHHPHSTPYHVTRDELSRFLALPEKRHRRSPLPHHPAEIYSDCVPLGICIPALPNQDEIRRPSSCVVRHIMHCVTVFNGKNMVAYRSTTTNPHTHITGASDSQSRSLQCSLQRKPRISACVRHPHTEDDA